ncbi:MAG: TetR family transcriptional regulator, partial [Ilumatobacteraceae bacterium]
MASDDTRRRILDAAIEVIGAEGEDKLRVADVARRAGVTQGMVTYH